MQFIRKNFSKLLIAFLVLGGAIGLYKYYAAPKTAAVTEKTAMVTKGELIRTISATGSLSATDNVDINSKITGRIVQVFVKENQHVNAGDPLVKLDDTTLVATQTQMAAKLQNASVTYNRYLELVNQGALARSEFDAVEADYIVAKANYDTATSNVRDTVITSPIEGYIIGEPTPVGQTVSSGISAPQVLMSVANLDKMQIEVLVDESDIGQIEAGQKVNFTVDAYTDKTFTGTVRLVSKSAVTSNNVIYYTVYVDVDNSEGKLLPTMTARTEIIAEDLPETLIVPLSAISNDEQGRFVQVYDTQNKKVARKEYVEVVMSNDESSAIKGNISEGEEVILRMNTRSTSTQSNVGGPPPHM
ncbi:MAG TPA: efflux RND transporter periplasmic adaptor subunit [Candidatus Avacidaminococcus intestinavium]|uniref:Efflux RND transporter periplasmic adaptor subunit n=1 Tax=Candidatus Avacidaminococcus intestinavium TaxID=2840684 RepID=A0A9D1SLM7_9FIRM|nr:efflux RND transporter periplasmic adaptor subunit [Candidatus Avacidaminococcus intestinavium]